MQTIDRIDTDVVVVGGGLTGLTLASELRHNGINVQIIERSEKLGGAIQSYHRNGFTYESGPTTAIISNAEVASLLNRLGRQEFIQLAENTASKRLILKDECFEPLPSGLVSAIQTPLFSWSDKFRILLEPFRAKGTNPNETLSQMVLRRLGKSYLDYAINPFIGGIYAGDPDQLVPRFALPKLWKLEQEYGSFIRGAIKKKRTPKTEAEQSISKEIFSACGGLHGLIQRLSEDIGQQYIHTSTNIISTHQDTNHYWLIDTDKATFRSRYLVTTTNAKALPDILSSISTEQLQPITELTYAPVVQIAVGYSSYLGIPFDAFGVLAPSCQTKDWLGILCPSSFFSDRAPKSGRLFSVFLGGIRNPEIIGWGDEKIRKHTLSLMRKYISPNQEPDLMEIFRHQYAIPQYTASTEQRLERIQQLEQQYQGLVLAGNIRDGIGIADRIAQGVTLSRELVHKIKDTRE